LAGLSEIDAAQVIRCARTLLRHPWLRESAPDGALLPLIYRHRVVLGELFGAVLGYRLVVRRGWARLHKTGRGFDGSRGEAGFSPRSYAFLVLTIAVLEGGARQTLLSRLVADVHAAAVEAAVPISDDPADRSALATALRLLVRLGVITETEGSVGSVLGEHGAEALITVDRDLLAELASGPILDTAEPAELIERAADPGPAGDERAVRRELVENPAVFFADLPQSRAEWLRAHRRSESRLLEDLFGLVAESRAEGVIATDPQDRLTDLAFPGQSTVARLALLALPVLLEDSIDDEEAESDGRVPITQQRLSVVCADLVADYPGTWSVQETADADRLALHVRDLLLAMGIAGRDEDALWLNPVAHRFAITAEGAGPPPTEPPPPELTRSLFANGEE
jgi:uncharacterized protein (TIGR02678 family)